MTNAICQRLIPQQHNKTTPPMVSQRLHPAAPLLPLCCQPLPSLATCLNASCLPPNTGVGQCRLTPGQSAGFDQCAAHCLNKINKVSTLCFNWSNTILATPRQQLLEMANGDGDGDCQRRWQLRWPMVTETAMADGKGSGNGNGDG
jgi:hypothetical protein